MITHLLFESASGYAIFEVKLHEDIAAKSHAIQESIKDLAKFSKTVNLLSFSPFKSAAHAFENVNDISEGILSDHLKTLLELNLSKPSKKSSVTLAVSDSVLASSIKSALNINCDVSDAALELIRGVRLHASKLLRGLQPGDLTKAQLGLGHSYSRAKLKFNVNRIDNMIIQAIALLDQLDKDVNLFSMRIREWYGYHFPELVKFVPDNHQYARVAQFIGDKETLNEEKLPELAEILDEDMTAAKNVLDAARGSMGSSLSEIDMVNIAAFATRVVSIAEYRKSLISYLSEKMNLVAPSLTALLGERIGARLISHAGSLTNLSKYPASTVQILGAEKALFRALKTKGNTPKYGLIYHSTFIGRAGPKFKGRISRFLANKCSIASRIDCYSDNPSPRFGQALRAQVEERLNFFETGTPPSKNIDAIRKVLDDLALEEADVEMKDEDSQEDEDGDEDHAQSSKHSAKEKKRKRDEVDGGAETKSKKEKKNRKHSVVTDKISDTGGKEAKQKKRKSDAMIVEEVDDSEPLLTTLEATPGRASKKRSESDAMDVDEERRQLSTTKAKLSKEEKKKAKKDAKLQIQTAVEPESPKKDKRDKKKSKE